MPMMLVLTPAQADAMRGPTTPGRALEPRDLLDGRYALPLAVLGDDHGVAVMAKLRALPQVAVVLPVAAPEP